MAETMTTFVCEGCGETHERALRLVKASKAWGRKLYCTRECQRKHGRAIRSPWGRYGGD